MNKIISPIAIDMGAKNTGVYLQHFEQGEDPTTSGNSAGRTIVIDGDSITWSQVNRTQKRHQVRGNKRRKLAKRLLLVILGKSYGISPTREQADFLMGLMNRRGYNRLVEDLDEKLIKQPLVAEYFVKKHEDFFKNRDTFFDNFIALSNDIEKCKALKEQLILSKKEAKKAVDDDKDGQQAFADAYDNMKSALDKQIKSEDEGHKHREEYLKNIKKDIQENSLLNPLLNDELTAECIANLIGNISNLQLRVLRKYFNDKQMQNSDKWLPQKLHKLFFRWIQGWHCKQDDEKEKRNKLLKLKQQDILKILATSAPELTIPPYEDQNNRIKETIKDKTLRLKPSALDKKMNNWLDMTQKIVKHYCLPTDDSRTTTLFSINENIEDCTHKMIQGVLDDYESRKSANILQRIFDRSKFLDPYKLRLLCSLDSLEHAKDDARKSLTLLKQHIGDNNAQAFISLCKSYYAETEIARQGLWSDNKDSLFFCCDTNPPHKSKLQHRLVGHIVCKTLSEPELESFKKDCWSEKITGARKTAKSVAKSIEEIRKKYGNEFNDVMKRIKRREYVLKSKPEEITEQQKKGWEKYEEKHKNVKTAIEDAAKVATHIADYFEHDDDKKAKYANPYSIAQLYNHLETDIGGFSKTDRYNTEENAWRNEISEEIPENKIANAVRLTKDSVRPFDGMLGRILERQAYEIARHKIVQLEGLGIGESGEMLIPVLLEQNKFKFEKSLHDIKGEKNVSTKAKDRVEEGEKRQQEQWEDKDKRIKGNKICPYTGETIGVGEIDHIIPQAKSRQHGDVVYNSEANLLYCSGRGNQEKGDNRYSFEQLNSEYLREVFGNKSPGDIKQEIRQFINNLDTDNFSGFHNLESHEQNYLRHALFLQDLDEKTFPLLNTRYRTLVNGTQAYLAKLLVRVLRGKYPNAEFKVYQMDAQEVSRVRDVLCNKYEEYKKSDKQQGAFSHVIDAAMVLATALQNQQVAERLKTVNTVELSENADWLKKLLPQEAIVQHIKRRAKYHKDLSSTKIFKETIYGERFMPVLLNDGKLFCGFSLDNCIEINPLIKGGKDENKKIEKQKREDNEYFNLLKEFLYTGSTRRKNKASVSGSLDDYHGKFGYLSVDKSKALAHLQKCAKEVCDDEDIKQAEALEELRYCVEKKNIKNLITGKKFISQSDFDKFKFDIDDITLPAKVDWERLINFPVIDCHGKTTTMKTCFREPAQDFIPQKSWDNLFEEFFHTNKMENSNHHKRVRKVYSLPVISSPSGGFRIKRKNPVTGDDVYQVSAIENSYACGFSQDSEGNIDMSEKGITFDPQLKSSANVAYLGKSGKPHIVKNSNDTDVEKFGSCRRVNLESEHIMECKLTLAEGKRIDISIMVGKYLFKEICEFSDINFDQPPSNLQLVFEDETKCKKFKQLLTKKKIPIPRIDKNKVGFAVQSLPKKVELSYRTSLTDPLRDAYKCGDPVT